MRKKIVLLCAVFIFVFVNAVFAQLPVPSLDESLISPSPNAASMATFGVIPVSMYEGIPNVSIPVYTIKSGSLSLPLSLDYNYNGFRPKEDASWCGLGWNLAAGGSVTRVIQDKVDGSITTSGHNYGEYDVKDSINSNSFQQSWYAGNYDIAPDIFIFNFPGHSGKFTYYNGTAYTFPYEKLQIYKPSNDSYIRITDENGTVYTFSDYEVTNTLHPKPTDPTILPYKSTWHLSSIVSANKKDTITFSYTSGYTYKEYNAPYGQTMWHSVPGPNYFGLTGDSTSDQFSIAPYINAKALSSIDCNTTHVAFTVTSSREDINGGNYPELQSILITDKVRSSVIYQCAFTYEFFKNSNHPASNNYERLKLKTFAVENAADFLPYSFSYNKEYSDFPIKNTYGIDYWGYFNGHDAGSTDYHYGQPNANLFGAYRDPDSTYSSYGILDTIVYPTGGFTTFKYELNRWVTSPGPGLRIRRIASFGNDSTNPSLSQNYLYPGGGNLYNGNTYMSSYNYAYTNGSTSNYTITQASLGSSFGGLLENQFYYSDVTQSDTAGTEIHRTDYAFNSFIDYLTGIDLTQKTDYVYSATAGYRVRSQQNNNVAVDPSYNNVKVDCYNLVLTGTSNTTPTQSFSLSDQQFTSAWKYPTSQTSTYYDDAGNPAATTTNYYYNTSTTNLQESSSQASDGSYTLTKLKYPEDYTTGVTGGLTNKHVLSPVIETQIWRKNSSTDSVMLSGKIVKYDTTLIVPVNEYYLETLTPKHTLSAEGKTGGLYNALVSDSNYINRVTRQFDTYGNLIEQNKSSDENMSYIWAYNHSLPVAQVKNASPSQIAYTSFETNETGNWSYSGSTASGGKTGDYKYPLSGGNITTGTLASGWYNLTYWSDNTAATIGVSSGTVSTPVNGESDSTGWKYYRHSVHLTASGTITVSGTSNIDELRLYPLTAQMTTATYYPGVGISSQCSPNNRINYFQYDGHNRLITVFDQRKYILKTIQYNYKNANNNIF